MSGARVSRDVVLRVLEAFKVQVKELSNDWYELRTWGVFLEEIKLREQVDPRHVVRLANRLKVPAHLFWRPELLEEYIKLNEIGSGRT